MNDGSGKALCIGLTGGLACGKSTVGRIWEDAGIEVLDADMLAHKSLAKDGEAYAQVVEAFGPGILDDTGSIDRKKLGERVFGDDSALDRLNGMVHPIVRRQWRAWTAERREIGATVAVIIPLLFEVGETEGWDAIVCVIAPENLVRERLKARGLNDVQIKLRLAAQWPLEQKREHADYVIENDGSIEDLSKKAKNTLNLIMTKEK